MALVIRKVRKLQPGDKVYKGDNALGQINSNTSNAQQTLSESQKVYNGANALGQLTTPQPPAPDPNKKAKIFVNGKEFELTQDWIDQQYQYVDTLALNNKQLNYDESIQANNQIKLLLTDALKNKSTVRITNGTLNIDDSDIIQGESYRNGWDNKLKEKQVASYIIGYWGGWKNRPSNEFKFRDFEEEPVRIISLNNNGNRNGNSDGDSDSEEETPTQRDLHKSEFIKKNNLQENSYYGDTDDLLKSKNYFRFTTKDGKYVLTTYNPETGFTKISDLNTLAYNDKTKYGLTNFGNVYVKDDNGNYGLYNKDTYHEASPSEQNRWNTEIQPSINVWTDFDNYMYNLDNPNVAYRLDLNRGFLNEGHEKHTDYTDDAVSFKDSPFKYIYIPQNKVKRGHFGWMDYSGKDESGNLVGISGVKVIDNQGNTHIGTIKDENGNITFQSDEKGSTPITLTRGDSSSAETALKKYTTNRGSDIWTFTHNKFNDDYYNEYLNNLKDEDGNFIITDAVKNLLPGMYYNKNKGFLFSSNSEPFDYTKIPEYIQNTLSSLNTSDSRTKNKIAQLLLLARVYYQYVPNSIDKDKKYKQLINKLDTFIKKYQGVSSQKQGGYLRKLQTGDAIFKSNLNFNVSFEPSEKKEFKQIEKTEKPSSKDLISLNNLSNLDWKDAVRTGATIANIASLTGGPAGVIAGLIGAGAETVADLADPNVTAGETALNLAMNFGFALLAAVPGLASTRIAKTAVKGGTKTAKALNKLKNIANNGLDLKKLGVTEELSENLSKQAINTLTNKDAKSILTSVDDILKQAKTDENIKKSLIEAGIGQKQIDDLSELVKTGLKSIKNPNNSAIISGLSAISPVANLTLGTAGFINGLSTGADVFDKVNRGDYGDISLQEIQNIASGVAGYKGLRNFSRNVGLHRVLTDDAPTPSEIKRTLKFKDKSDAKNKTLTWKTSKTDADDVKLEMEEHVSNLKNRRNTSGLSEDEIKALDEEIKLHDYYLENFNEYWPNFQNFGNKAGKTKDGVIKTVNKFWDYLKPIDASGKRLKSEDDLDKWFAFRNVGLREAKRLGFTETGIDNDLWNNTDNLKVFDRKLDMVNVFKPMTPKMVINRNKNSDSSQKSELFKNFKEFGKQQFKNLGSGMKRVGSNIKTFTKDTTQRIKTYSKNLAKKKMISKIEDKIDILSDITLPDGVRYNNFQIYKKYKQDLVDLKKMLDKSNKLLTTKTKNELLASVGQHNPELYNMIQSLKKGNKVERKIKKYDDPAGEITQGDASTSAGTDPIRFDYSDMYDFGFGMGGGYAPVMKNHSIKFDPEAAFNAAYFANQFASVNKVAELLTPEVLYHEAPYLHLPVKRNLLEEQNFLNLINDSRYFTGLNLTSDNQANSAIQGNLQNQILNATNTFGAKQIDDLNNQRDLAINQEYKNEVARISNANTNTDKAETYIDLLHKLRAGKVQSLATITGNALQKFSEMANSRMLARKESDYLNALADNDLNYTLNVQSANNWLENNQTFESSKYGKIATALGINSTDLVTQEQVDAYLNKANAALPEGKKYSEYEVNFWNSLVGNTLQDLYNKKLKTTNQYVEDAGIYRNSTNQRVASDFKRDLHYHTYVPNAKKGTTLEKYKIDKKYDIEYKKLQKEYQKLMLAYYKENSKNLLNIFKK